MLHIVKRRLYFIVAGYFAFWAKFVLRRWQPRIVVVTGSTGKTTTLHLIEAQLGDKALYSHHANGAFGLSFHILGMHPNVEHKWLWPVYLVTAPFKIFRRLPKAKLYIAEADCDRPHEGKFIAAMLRPEVTLWVSVFRTHSMNFDRLVSGGVFKTHEEAIAYEFGNFAAATTGLVIANGTQPRLTEQLERVHEGVTVETVSEVNVDNYRLADKETIFKIQGQEIHVPGLHPREIGLNLGLVSRLVKYLGEPLDPDYSELVMPPGRSTIFQGKKGTVLVDSTYNTGLGASKAILHLFEAYPNEHKWLVLGDILEQGSLEQSEHENLAHVVSKMHADRVILLGPRTKAHTLPILQKEMPKVELVSFDTPKETLDYLQKNLTGGEALLFKGGRFLEGVIEQLLEDPADEARLVRRGNAWTKRRQKWGLPR
jgi:UDP-N-acetylmuramyl pentapeptide synthase